MKKLLILALVLAPVIATAQDQTTVNVTTTIRGAFTLSPTNLAFGNVQAGTETSISILDAQSNVGNTASRGAVELDGTTADVIYNITSANLNEANGTTLTIPYSTGSGSETPLVITLVYGRNPSSAVSYDPGNATTGTTDAERSLVIGGTFTAVTGQATNVYSAALTVSVIYI